jgi:periplasmic protein TonB
MVKPLLYRPEPRWHWWTALTGAVVIHLAAVALAQKREPPPVDLSQIPQAVVIATIEAPEEQPTPPPEEIAAPPPPEPEIKPEYVEERTPPPRQPKGKVAPIKAPTVAGHPGVMSISNAKAVAVYAPRPQYPYEARSRRITGSGVCVLDIDVASGSVSSANMAQSIGNPILDNAAVSAFRQWRFKPGAAAPKVKVPITFTLTGASY